MRNYDLNQNGPDEGQEPGVEMMEQNPIALMQAGEINQQIATARAFPRNLTKFSQKMNAMALYNLDVAQSCYYVLKRRNADGTEKTIIGASIRLAEIGAQAYGNIRCGSRVIAEDDRFIVAQGVAHDLENNMFITTETRRRISGKRGKFSDDMIVVTANAAASIALRNSILRLLPRPMVEEMVEKCRAVVRGDVKDLATRRDRLTKKFAAEGVKAERIYAAVGVKGLEDITPEHLEILFGMFTACKDGRATWEEQFPPVPTAEELLKNKTGTAAAASSTAKAPEAKKEKESTKPAEPTLTPYEKFEAGFMAQGITIDAFLHWLKDTGAIDENDEAATLQEVFDLLTPKQVEGILANFSVIGAEIKGLKAPAPAQPDPRGNATLKPRGSRAAKAKEAEKAKEPATTSAADPAQTETAQPEEHKPGPMEHLAEGATGTEQEPETIVAIRRGLELLDKTEAQLIAWGQHPRVAKIPTGVSNLAEVLEVNPAVINFIQSKLPVIAKEIEALKL